MMRENESDHEGQPDGYVSPWAPRIGGTGDTGETGDDPLPPYYASSYREPPGGPVPGDSALNDTIAFGAPPPRYGQQPEYGQQDFSQRPDYRQHQGYDQHQGYTQPQDYARQDYGQQPPDWGNWISGDGYGPPPPPRSGRGSRLLIYLAVAAVAAGVGAGATVVLNGGDTTPSAGVSAHENIPAQHNNAAGSGSNASLNQASVERKVEPGLVDIISTLQYNSETAEGTGMILSADGLVLTNNHVIDQSTSVKAIQVDGGRTYRARVLGYDATDDVALLQLEGASRLPVVNFGNSDQISIGTPVLALGNAEGRGGATPAPGIINALNRSIKASDEGSGGTENLHNMLQTSAQIQQGDSGGALANNAGQVIGMITAANTSPGQAGGTIGFAIPINTALNIARQVASDASSSTVYVGTPGFLGVVLAQSTSSSPQQQARDEQAWLAQNGGGASLGGGSCIENNTQLSTPQNVAPASSGVLVIDAFCGTAVNQAGLEPGDVITSVNGHAVTTPGSLRGATGNYHPGEVVSIGWEDISGGRHSTAVTLGPGPVR